MPPPTRHRPFGITLLAGYDIVMVAVVPAGLAMLRYFGADAAARPELLHVFASMLLAGGIVVTAAAVWRAEDWARYVLVALVTIYYTGLAFDAPYTVDLAAGAGGASDTLEVWLRVGRSIFWIVLHGWYLFSAAAWFFDPQQLGEGERGRG
jgi:hypothetical protein